MAYRGGEFVCGDWYGRGAVYSPDDIWLSGLVCDRARVAGFWSVAPGGVFAAMHHASGLDNWFMARLGAGIASGGV